MSETFAWIGIGFLIAVPYFIVGVGVAKMVAKINQETLRLSAVCFWPICAIIYAVLDGVIT